jgi:hypothetical protein
MKRSPAPGTLDGAVAAILTMTVEVGDSSQRKNALKRDPIGTPHQSDRIRQDSVRQTRLRS